MNKMLKPIIVTLFIALTGGTLYAIVIKKVFEKELVLQAHRLKEPKARKVKYNLLLIEKLQEVSKQMDLNKEECFVSGKITMVNHADSADYIKDLHYLFSKKGDDFYYKIANTETMNYKGIYLYLDHDLKKVMISSGKKASGSDLFADLKQIQNQLKEENYSLSSSTNGTIQTISLKNMYHPSCKEYAVAFDTLSRKVISVFLRLSNPEDPLSENMDKEMTISLSEISPLSGIDKYINTQIISQDGGRWIISDRRYRDYNLIVM